MSRKTIASAAGYTKRRRHVRGIACAAGNGTVAMEGSEVWLPFGEGPVELTVSGFGFDKITKKIDIAPDDLGRRMTIEFELLPR